MKQPKESYQSFLLRCWFVPSEIDGEQPTWRFVLRDVSAEPQDHLFSSFEQMTAFISAELQQTFDPDVSS